MSRLVLKKGRETPISILRHPWIFSGAIAECRLPYDGACVPVYDSSQSESLGLAMVNLQCPSLIGRMVSFSKSATMQDVPDVIRNNIRRACDFRTRLPFISSGKTNCYRVVNSEADNLPSLVVDRYADRLVLSSGSLGIDLMVEKGLIVDTLIEHSFLKNDIRAVYERSSSGSRKAEKVADREGYLWRSPNFEPTDVVVLENGIPMIVDVQHGQKTGLFLDQRNMRSYVQKLSTNKRVLHLCCCTGGFSLSALAGGAKSVVSVDISESSLAMLERNIQLGVERGAFASETAKHHKFVQGDLWQFLDSHEEEYDLIILDPPKLAGKASDVPKALKAYTQANEHAMRLAASTGAFFLTFSCSNPISAAEFEKAVLIAARATNRNVRLLQRHRQAEDHATSWFHPEGEYLKSLVLHIE